MKSLRITAGLYLYSTSNWTHVDTRLAAQNFFRPWKKKSEFVDGRIFFTKEFVNKMTSTLSNNDIEDVIKNFLFTEDYGGIAKNNRRN